MGSCYSEIVSRLTKETAASLIATVSEQVHNVLHDKSLCEKNRNEDRRGQCYLYLDLSAMSELRNETHFSAFSSATHTWRRRKASFYFYQVYKVMADLLYVAACSFGTGLPLRTQNECQKC